MSTAAERLSISSSNTIVKILSNTRTYESYIKYKSEMHLETIQRYICEQLKNKIFPLFSNIADIFHRLHCDRKTRGQ